MNTKNDKKPNQIISFAKFLMVIILVILLVRERNTYKDSLENLYFQNRRFNGYLEDMAGSISSINANFNMSPFEEHYVYKMYQDGYDSPYIITSAFNLYQCSQHIGVLRQFFDFILPVYTNKEFEEFVPINNLYASMQNFLYLYGDNESELQLHLEDLILFKEYSELLSLQLPVPYRRTEDYEEFSLDEILVAVNNFNQQVVDDPSFSELIEKYSLHIDE